MSDFDIETDIELKRQIQEAAKSLLLRGWRSKDVASLVGTHTVLTGEEALIATGKQWERGDKLGWQHKPTDWTDAELMEKWRLTKEKYR